MNRIKQLEKENEFLQRRIEQLELGTPLTYSGNPSLYKRIVKHLTNSKHFKRWINELELNNPDLDVNDIVFSIEHTLPKKEYFYEEVQTDTGKGVTRELTSNNLSDLEIRKAVGKRLRKHGLIKDGDIEKDYKFENFMTGYTSETEVDSEALDYIPNFVRLHKVYQMTRLMKAVDVAGIEDNPEWLNNLQKKLKIRIEEIRIDIERQWQ